MSILVDLIKSIIFRKPDLSQISAMRNLDVVMQQTNKLNQGVNHLRQVLATNPDNVEALYALGQALLMLKSDEALDHLRQVIRLDHKHYAAISSLLNQMRFQCAWHEADSIRIRELRQSIHQASTNSKTLISPFTLFSLPGVTAAEQKLCAMRWAQTAAFGSVKQQTEFKWPAHKKIRLGYLSADFHQHAVAYQMAEIFELHDRERFHVTAYSYGPDDGSSMRKRLEIAFDDFQDIRGFSLEEVAEQVQADQIDILIDLTGYTGDTQSWILALRPAPIQVNYLGYAGTMGADFVDYIIADQFTIPQDQRQHYTEKVVWMPDTLMPNDRSRPRLPAPSRKEAGLPENGFVFCCFNQAYKITPEIFDIWCRLLKALPDSVLWLSSGNPQVEINLKREAEMRGVSAVRILMAPRIPMMEDHLARLQCADLFLDTAPFNAHSTCSDALWMGLPVVTCAGETFPSRVAGSLLNAIGAPELITYNLDDYYQLALDLASNPDKLAAVRSKIIANRDTAPLFDSTRFTRNLEQIFIQMLNEHADSFQASS